VNIREDREARRGAYALERGEPSINPRSSRRITVRAVGFVEARLVDDSARDAFRQARESLSDSEVQAVVFQNARAGNQKEPVRRKQFRHAIPPL
jgi:hypothetical protein